MTQTFSPYRLAFALVLSVVLVLSVTQLTQAKTSHMQQQYPSQTQAEAVIMQYYEHESKFSGKNTIQHFDSLTYRPVYQVFYSPQNPSKSGKLGEWSRFDVCAQYQFAPVTSPAAKQTARNLFTFEITYIEPETWNVISMALNAC